MTSINKKINLKKQLVAMRKAIKSKLLALKLGESESHEQFKKHYKPLLEPLKEIVEVQKKSLKTKIMDNIKNEPMLIKTEKDNDYDDLHTPISSKSDGGFANKEQKNLHRQLLSRKLKYEAEKNVEGEEEDDESDDAEGRNKSNIESVLQYESPKTIDAYLQQYHPIPRKYMADLMYGDKGYDLRSGIRYDKQEKKWKIGSSDVEIEESNIIIGGKHYKGTIGLYELLFKKVPKTYSHNDIMNYRDIIVSSNAFNRNYDSNDRLEGLRSIKYQKIIKPMFEKKDEGVTSTKAGTKLREKAAFKRGGALNKEIHLNRKRHLEYVYWDDINELVDRLYLLHASQHAGNTSVNNEIISIEEELREAGVIV